MEKIEYQENDNVLLYSEILKKHIIGKISEIKIDQGIFIYNRYYKPDDLSEEMRNQQYFSAYELFPTDEHKREKIENIKEKVTILKMSEYIQKEVPDSNDLTQQKFYIQRTNYDIDQKTFCPDLTIAYTCFCDQIINPDHALILCTQCKEKMYHYNCLTEKTQCDKCGVELKKDMFSSELRLKRHRDIAGPSSLNKQQSTISIGDDDADEDEDQNIEVFQKKRKVVNKNRIQELFLKLAKQEQPAEVTIADKNPPLLKSDNKIEKNMLKRNNSSSNNQSQQVKQQYSNLTEEQMNQLNILVDRYRQSNCLTRITGIDKQRHTVKERLLKLIVYGALEIQSLSSVSDIDMKNLLKSNQTLEQLDEQRNNINSKFQEIKDFDQQQLYDYARKQAISIEVTLFSAKNQQNRFQLMSEYKDRFRIIQSNMIDIDNTLLRQKVLLNTMTVGELIEKPDSQLWSLKKQQEVQRLKEKEYQQGELKKDGFIYIKTNKNETQIMKDDREDEETLKKLKREEEAENLRKQKELALQKAKELEEKGRVYEYRDFLGVNQGKEELSKFQLSLSNAIPKQIDSELVQNLIDLIAGNGKARMIKRIQDDIPKEQLHIFLDALEKF